MRFVDKTLARLHSSILNIHNVVGEKEAAEWLTTTEKRPNVIKTKEAKTPAKKPKTVTKLNSKKSS